MKLANVMIITPTTGVSYLKDAVMSIQQQTYPNLQHLIVTDGKCYAPAVNAVLDELQPANTTTITLPWNSGFQKFNGHRIYAAMSVLVEADYIFFLDEDNIYEEDHVTSLVNLMVTQELDWAYSFRKIIDEGNTCTINDNCESIGPWPPFSNKGTFIDTNCYAVSKEAYLQCGAAWYGKSGGDRRFYDALTAHHLKNGSSGLYTVRYRLNNNSPVSMDYFHSGNDYMLKLYNGYYPWNTILR